MQVGAGLPRHHQSLCVGAGGKGRDGRGLWSVSGCSIDVGFVLTLWAAMRNNSLGLFHLGRGAVSPRERGCRCGGWSAQVILEGALVWLQEGLGLSVLKRRWQGVDRLWDSRVTPGSLVWTVKVQSHSFLSRPLGTAGIRLKGKHWMAA